MHLLRLSLYLTAASTCAAIQPPGPLSVTSATNQQVQLSWTSGDPATDEYIVERSPVGGAFAALSTIMPNLNDPAAMVFIDTNFDPFTAYSYRVRSVNTHMYPPDVSQPGNAVTAGPPPYGFTQVIRAPDSFENPAQYGAAQQMILDQSGDPMFTYLIQDPDQTGDFTTSEIWFVRWDRTNYTWTQPVRVTVPGYLNMQATIYDFRLAQDAATGMIAILYIDHSQENAASPLFQLSIAASADGGATWQNQLVQSDPVNSYFSPALAALDGVVYIAFYLQGINEVEYVTGNLANSPATWANQVVPLAGHVQFDAGCDLALDSAGKPAVVYIVEDDDPDNGHFEVFYRPGGNAVIANTSLGTAPGEPWQMRLRFSGTNPLIGIYATMDDVYYDDYDHNVYSIASADGGVTWAPRVNIPSDGNMGLAAPLDVSLNSQGAAALTEYDNGGNDDGVVCGQPKMSLSSDLVNWTTCGIAGLSTMVSHVAWPNVRYAFNDTLFVSYQADQFPDDPTDATESSAGIWFWRGPIGFQFPSAPPQQ